MNKYRYEYKYGIDSVQEAILLLRAESIMSRDPHAGAEGSYWVRSLYFDSYYDECLSDVESGVDLRSKYRMRYYNNDTGYICLEKKSKIHGKTLKQSCRLSREEAEALVKGEIPQITQALSEEKWAMFLEMQLRSLIPKVIVSYERIPFLYPAGNVRITFDRSIMSSNDIGHFLEGNYYSRSVLQKGTCILEVKWDELLPLAVKNVVSTDHLQWISFSKYHICRVYHL